MGVRGKKVAEESVVVSNPLPKKSKDRDTHRDLCIKAARWLMRRRNYPCCTYSVVELCPQTGESPDVFGWNYWTSVLIEVKVSRSDFLADKKKSFRIFPDDGIGEYRYYCCPSGLIKPDEVPQHWGLIYEDEGTISVIKGAERQLSNYRAERTIFTPIIRRENIGRKLFDYRDYRNEKV